MNKCVQFFILCIALCDYIENEFANETNCKCTSQSKYLNSVIIFFVAAVDFDQKTSTYFQYAIHAAINNKNKCV